MTPIEWIFEAACKATGLTPAQARGRSRLGWIVARRKFIAQKMRQEGYSYPRIAKALGGRDHTTIIYYLRDCDRMGVRP